MLPAAAAAERQTQYRELIKAWISDTHKIDVVLDSELAAIPDDRCVWVLGRDNRYAAELIAADAVAQSGTELRCRSTG